MLDYRRYVIVLPQSSGESALRRWSMVPLEDNYLVEIVFRDGLTTNYGICLPACQEMKATVGIAN